MSKAVRQAVPYSAIIATTLITYGMALWNGYVWDDLYFLQDDQWVYDLKGALDASLAPLFGQRAYVRPLPLLSIYFEAIISDRNPMLSHAVNLVVHAACGILVYLVARRAAPNLQRLALFLALLFITHPALTEAAIWISSRFDLLATLFMLLAVWYAGRDSGDWTRAFIVGALFFVAALSKENAAMLPAIIGIQALLLGSMRRGDTKVVLKDAFTPRELKTYAVMFAAGLIYLVIRHSVLSGSNLLSHSDPGLQEHLVRIGLSLYKYAQLTAVPFINNSPHHSFIWTPESSLITYWPQILFALLLLLAAALLAFNRNRSGWLLLAWLACFVPVLHIIPIAIGGNLIHQRFMYFPTAILLSFSPFMLEKVHLTQLARKSVYALGGLFIALSILTCWSIIPVWKSNFSLWKWAVAADPASIEARENLIHTYLEAGMFDEAHEQLGYFAINNIRTSPNVAVNFGTHYHRKKDFEAALYYYNMAYPVMGSLPPVQQSRIASNLATTHLFLGNPDESKRYLKEAIELNPANDYALQTLLVLCQNTDIDPSAYDERTIRRIGPLVTRFKHQIKEGHPDLDIESGLYCPYSK